MRPVDVGPRLGNGTRLGSAAEAAFTGYLELLGIDDPGEPSVSGLRALHRAHVERVPYEALDFQLGRPTTVDPWDSIARILRGRGGYCVQLNGAFSTLLSALGYDVSWHCAGVQASRSAPPPGSSFAPHLVPIVALEGELWLADIGLGDGLHEPVPLRVGTYRQGPFTYELAPSQVETNGWRFEHDPRGSIAGLDFTLAPATLDDFAKWHPYVSTSPESRVVRLITVMRCDRTGADRLMGCVLNRVDEAGKTSRELTTANEWFGALTDVFGLSLEDVDEKERAALWAKVRANHQNWLAARAQRVRN